MRTAAVPAAVASFSYSGRGNFIDALLVNRALVVQKSPLPKRTRPDWTRPNPNHVTSLGLLQHSNPDLGIPGSILQFYDLALAIDLTEFAT